MEIAGVVIYSRDAFELCEYLCPLRRTWKDQEHRQTLSREEMQQMLDQSR